MFSSTFSFFPFSCSVQFSLFYPHYLTFNFRRRSRSRSPPQRGGPGSFDRFGRNSRDGYGRDREISGRDVGRDRNQGNFNKDFVGGRDRDRDRDWGRRDRSRSRERDRDRGGYRERSRDNKDQYRDRGDYRNHDGMSAEVYDACRDPTCTIIVKGLAPRTTEPTVITKYSLCFAH